jgi:hypothetical protein
VPMSVSLGCDAAIAAGRPRRQAMSN